MVCSTRLLSGAAALALLALLLLLVVGAWLILSQSQRTQDAANAQTWRCIHETTRAIQRAPSDATQYINRGLCYKDVGMYDQAVQDLTTAMRLQPQSADALKNRAIAYEQWGKLPEALADYERFLAWIADMPTERRARERREIGQKVQAIRAQLAEQ